MQNSIIFNPLLISIKTKYISRFQNWENSVLPPENIYTAEFVHKFDNLFDLLNNSILDHELLKSALFEGAPHSQFWSELLKELD